MENLTLVPLSLVLVLVALLLYKRFRPQASPKSIKPRLSKALEFEKVTMCMTEADSLFFIRQKKALRDLGFLEIADFTVPTMSPKGYYRAFAHPEHPIYAVLAEIVARKPDQYLAFYSRFSEGPFLLSDNLDRTDDGKKSRFQRLPGAQADELLTHHQKILKETIEGGAKALPATREGFFREYAEILLAEILSAKSPKGFKREDLQKELDKVHPVDLKFFLKPLPPPPVEVPSPPEMEAKEAKEAKTTGKLNPGAEKGEKTEKTEKAESAKTEKPAKPERRWTRPSELKKAEAAEEPAEITEVTESVERVERTERIEKPEKPENVEKPEIEPFNTPTLLKFIPSEEPTSEEAGTLIRFDQIPVDGEGTLPFDTGEAEEAFDTGETLPFDAPASEEEKTAQPVASIERTEKSEEPEKPEKPEAKEALQKSPTRMKAPETCPACGEPVLSPLASYCRKCKAYLRGQKS